MATSEGISDEDFRQLLVDVSNWYDDHEYISMLKVLYRDHVTNASQLQSASKVIDLLGFLYASGDLSPTDLTLLYDTIKATQQFGLERTIKNQIPSCPNIRSIVISTFTPHRQKLMKLGMALTQDEVEKISGLYNNPIKRYADSWSLIINLEHRMIICEKKMETFVNKLERNIPQAVVALLKEFGKVPPEYKPQSTGQPSNKVPPENKPQSTGQPSNKEFGKVPPENKPQSTGQPSNKEFGKVPPENKPQSTGQPSNKEFGKVPPENKPQSTGQPSNKEFGKVPPENKPQSTGQPSNKEFGKVPPENKPQTTGQPSNKEFGKVPPENKPQSTGQPSNKGSEYDFYVISEDIEWENKVLKELQTRKPAVKCLSTKDWKYGKFKFKNLINPVKQCQKVVVGFTSQPVTSNLEFVAATAVQQMLNNNTLDQGKLIPVRVTEDAVIPDYLEPITVAKGWEENFYDKLLNTLSEQEIKVEFRCSESIHPGNSLRPDDPMNSSGEPIENVESQHKCDTPFKSNEVSEHFRNIGFSRVDGVTSEPSSLWLLTNDSEVLTKLWNEYQTGRLMEDLIKILSIEENQGDHSHKWSLYIDEKEYSDALANIKREDHEDQPPTKRPKLCKSSDHEKKMHNVDDASPLHPQILKRRDVIKLPSSCTALNLSNFIQNIQEEGISLVCTEFIASSVNLSSITGENLFTLLKVAPRLKNLYIMDCELSSDIVNDMVSRYLDSNNFVLEFGRLELAGNNLSNIDEEKISMLACKINVINFRQCKLLANFVEKLVTKCTVCNFTLKLTDLNIAYNDLSNIEGRTLSSLFKVSPLLRQLDINSCKLTGKIVNEMVQECNNNKLTLALKWFDISHNDLSEVEGRNLDILLNISPELHTLKLVECMLTGGVVNDMVIQSGQHNNFLCLYLSNNNLEDMDVTSFVKISKKFPNLECLSMPDCNVDDNKLKDMMDACKDGDVVLKDNVLCL